MGNQYTNVEKLSALATTYTELEKTVQKMHHRHERFKASYDADVQRERKRRFREYSVFPGAMAGCLTGGVIATAASFGGYMPKGASEWIAAFSALGIGGLIGAGIAAYRNRLTPEEKEKTVMELGERIRDQQQTLEEQHDMLQRMHGDLSRADRALEGICIHEEDRKKAEEALCAYGVYELLENFVSL